MVSSSLGVSPWQIERVLLRQILKKVSRSFYLSLVFLPPAVRPQVSLAYLFCRAADTIADTRLLPRDKRQQALDVFRRQFLLDVPVLAELESLRAQLFPHQVSEGERQLFAHLLDCFRLFARLSTPDRQLLRELVLTLTCGMAMDLHHFPGETAATAQALPDLATLDQYTYYVAGVVGAFWTKIHAAHLPALRRCDLSTLCALGVRFGKGLQFTNILKDVGKDLDTGRCYLPQDHLAQLDLDVHRLTDPAASVWLRPLIGRLVRYTLDYLDSGRDYVLHLPRRALRLRVSCMWPLLFAVQTLTRVCQTPELLQPTVVPKISRTAVYCTMGWSLPCLAVPRLFPQYYAYLRRRLLAALHQYEQTRVEQLTP